MLTHDHLYELCQQGNKLKGNANWAKLELEFESIRIFEPDPDSNKSQPWIEQISARI